MKILFITQYFPPEIGATPYRCIEMVRGLVSRGHRVTVITEFPNHPTGIIPPKYDGKWFEKEMVDGIEVIRVRVITSPKKTKRSRILFYFSFMWMAIWAGIFKTRSNYDLIYATSPPLFVGVSALVLHTLKRIPYVMEIRDLWPESAIYLGEISNSMVINTSKKVADLCHRHAKRIVVVTRSIYEDVSNTGIPREKITLIYNGSNTSLFRFDALERKRIRIELGLEDQFIVMYAGLIGLMYSFDTLVEVAKFLEKKKENHIHIVIIGEGPVKAALVDNIEHERLFNITVLPAQALEDLSGFLSAGDLVVAPIRKNMPDALPVKMFDAMACKRPVVLSAHGEGPRLIEEMNAGLSVASEDPEALTEVILKLSRDPVLCQKFGENGREAVEKHYSREDQAHQLEQLLLSIV